MGRRARKVSVKGWFNIFHIETWITWPFDVELCQKTTQTIVSLLRGFLVSLNHILWSVSFGTYWHINKPTVKSFLVSAEYMLGSVLFTTLSHEHINIHTTLVFSTYVYILRSFSPTFVDRLHKYMWVASSLQFKWALSGKSKGGRGGGFPFSLGIWLAVICCGRPVQG